MNLVRDQILCINWAMQSYVVFLVLAYLELQKISATYMERIQNLYNELEEVCNRLLCH